MRCMFFCFGGVLFDGCCVFCGVYGLLCFEISHVVFGVNSVSLCVVCCLLCVMCRPLRVARRSLLAAVYMCVVCNLLIVLR